MFADQRPQIVVVHQLRVNVPLARSLLLSCSSSNLYNLSPCFSFCLSPKQGTYTPPLCTRACARTCIWCAPYVRFSHTTVVFTPARNTFTRVGLLLSRPDRRSRQHHLFTTVLSTSRYRANSYKTHIKHSRVAIASDAILLLLLLQLVSHVFCILAASSMDRQH